MADVILKELWDGALECPACGHIHATRGAVSAAKRGLECTGCGRAVTLPPPRAFIPPFHVDDDLGGIVRDSTGDVVATLEERLGDSKVETIAALLNFLDGLHTTKAIAVLGIPPACLGGEIVVHRTAERGREIAILWPSGRLPLSKPDALNLLLSLARELLPLQRPFDALATLIPVGK